MKKIIFENLTPESQKKANYFSLNLAFSLSNKNYKILYFCSSFSSFYFQDYQYITSKLIKKNVIAPFKIYNFDNNLHYLLLIDQIEKKQNKINTNNMNEILNKQINVLENNYNFLIFNNLNIWKNINLDIKIESSINIFYFDALSPINFKSLLKNKAQNNIYVLDNYVIDNKIAISNFTHLKQIIKNNLFIFDNMDNNLKLFFHDRPFENKSIQMMELTDFILEIANQH